MQREKRWLLIILVVGALLRLGMALYLGDEMKPTPAAHDQIFYHDLALNLLAGKGFVFSRPPWPFIEPGVPTAFYSFLYPRFLAGVYFLFGPHPLAARIVQALICSLLPLQVYGLTWRIVGREKGGPAPLVAAGITAVYAYFVYYSATLMTEGLYLVTVAWSLNATLDLAERPSARRWLSWALAVGLASLLRQVFMAMAVLLFAYVLWNAWRRVRIGHLALAGATLAALILPWTVRNYLAYDRFLLLNSQAGQVLWNANHPDLGDTFNASAMFPVPDDLKGANEVDLSNELLVRAVQNITAEPVRFLRLSLSRLGKLFIFWPKSYAGLYNNVARSVSFTICLPFMVAGVVLSVREWRRWSLLYLFIAGYLFIHVISWVQTRYRLPVDVALVPFAAVAMVELVGKIGETRGR